MMSNLHYFNAYTDKSQDLQRGLSHPQSASQQSTVHVSETLRQMFTILGPGIYRFRPMRVEFPSPSDCIHFDNRTNVHVPGYIC